MSIKLQQSRIEKIKNILHYYADFRDETEDNYDNNNSRFLTFKFDQYCANRILQIILEEEKKK